MNKTVYIETTIPSYLAAKPARDLVQAGRQQLTHDWWDYAKQNHRLFTSQLVLDEAAAGNADAAEKRLAILEGMPILTAHASSSRVVKGILESGLLPRTAARDAVHIALSSIHGMDFLLTWNCRHIANATIAKELRSLISSYGYEMPVLSTPEGLLGEFTPWPKSKK